MKTFLCTFFLISFTHFFVLGNNLKYYPSDYEQAREQFLKLAKQRQFDFQQHKTQLSSFKIGKEQLSTDYFYIAASNESQNLIVMTSGTHGPEGYAGSASQALFLDQLITKLDLSNTGILLIHALNPWGFKHHRRGTTE